MSKRKRLRRVQVYLDDRVVEMLNELVELDHASASAIVRRALRKLHAEEAHAAVGESR